MLPIQKGSARPVKRAKDAGIVVVAVDVAAEGADATITSDNTQAGEMALIHHRSPKRQRQRGDPSKWRPGVRRAEPRRGCQTEFKRHPDIKVLSDNQNAKGSREGGLEVMTGLLAANPKIDGVFAINDPTADIGADLAAKQAQRNEFFIVGVDGSPDAEEARSVRTRCLSAIPAQDPQVMAAKAVEIGYDILQGKPAPKEPVLIPVTMIDKDNVGNYRLDGEISPRPEATLPGGSALANPGAGMMERKGIIAAGNMLVDHVHPDYPVAGARLAGGRSPSANALPVAHRLTSGRRWRKCAPGCLCRRSD